MFSNAIHVLHCRCHGAATKRGFTESGEETDKAKPPVLQRVVLARLPRFELGTLGLEIRCSIQLSYRRRNVFMTSNRAAVHQPLCPPPNEAAGNRR